MKSKIREYLFLFFKPVKQATTNMNTAIHRSSSPEEI